MGIVSISSPPERILIVRLSAIGDVVHTLPVAGVLRRHFPEARIGWLVEELSSQLLVGHPWLDDLWVVPKGRWRKAPVRSWVNGDKRGFYSELRRVGYDVGVDFQGLTKSGFALWMGGARARIGYGDKDGRELNKFFTNVRVYPDASRQHVIERNLALLGPLGIDAGAQEVGWEFPDFSDERKRLSDFLEMIAGRGSIMIYPGAGWPTKRWGVEKFIDLADLIGDASELDGRPIVLVWGPAEKAEAEEIVQRGRDHLGNRLLLAPATNLRELTVLLGEADVVVGGDTGPIHIAAALGIPVAGIYGASDPIRNGPWGDGHEIVVSEGCGERPCWKRSCNKPGGLVCLDGIEAQSVLDALLKTLTA